MNTTFNTTLNTKQSLFSGLFSLGTLSMIFASAFITPTALADDPPTEQCLNNPNTIVCGDEIKDPTLGWGDAYPDADCIELELISTSRMWEASVSSSIITQCNWGKSGGKVFPNTFNFERSTTIFVPIGGTVTLSFFRGGETGSLDDRFHYNVDTNHTKSDQSHITIRCEDDHWEQGIDCSFNGKQFQVDHTRWSISAADRLYADSFNSNGQLALSQCVNYAGGQSFERESCFEINHFFDYDENTRKLRMYKKYLGWNLESLGFKWRRMLWL